jgi:hypothetical protein
MYPREGAIDEVGDERQLDELAKKQAVPLEQTT